METEKRIVRGSELRAVATDGVTHLVGYAALFNVWSLDLGGWVEMVEPGAFTTSLKTADVRALFNHEEQYILGRTKAGTLTLAEDETGLRVDIVPPDTQYANDLIKSIERGDVDQMSFQFRCLLDDVRYDGGVVRRWLKEVELIDVSPVTFPAYPQTSVSLRSRLDSVREAAAIIQAGDDAARNEETRARLDLQRKRLDLLTV